MPQNATEDERLKNLLKSAVIEAIEERRDLFRELIAEALENISMVRAIEEGAATKVVDPSEVYKILDKKE